MPKVNQEHIEKRKDEILKAAKRVFLRKGFEPTTMQDVVEESGMSRGGVYQYFSSTEEMIQALHVRNLQELPGILEKVTAENKTIWEAVKALVDYFSDDENEDAEDSFGIVMFEYSVISWRNENRRKFIIENSQIALNQFVDLFQKGVDRGEFRPLQPLQAIAVMFAMITDGITLYSSITDPKMVYVKEDLEGLKLYLRTVLQVREEA
ncbi:MAG TPA: TetR family transcriptional regulator [Bacillales bacterium]|nr:TetR family transcriptional regulator [Bacillales bacterium]